MSLRTADIDSLIDDRPSDGIFRVSRDVFRDPDVFALEMAHIFEATWVFVGLESQLPKPHDFLTVSIGRQPVLLARDGAGKLRGFVNSCRHRGTLLCPLKAGNQKFHVCRYHGWAYDSGGRNVTITGEADAQYPDAFKAENHDLLPVARLESYRGLLFASLSDTVLPLDVHLGEARRFIDLALDQGESGVEFVPGAVTYTYDANWKLQFENGLDHYHFVTTHSSYVDVLQQRAKNAEGTPELSYRDPSEPEAQGSFSFANGHSAMWSIRQRQLDRSPAAWDQDSLDRLRERVGATRAKWMLRQRNLTIFPNLQIIDIVRSLQLRIWRPLAVDKTEMSSHCLALVGENAEAREMRIRHYEDFFNPTGLATSDDNVMYEYCQSGYQADGNGWTQGYSRGLGRPALNQDRYAEELGLAPADRAYGAIGFGDETCFHAGYRQWRRLLQQGLAR